MTMTIPMMVNMGWEKYRRPGPGSCSRGTFPHRQKPYAKLNHLAFWVGLILVLTTLWEAFETMILPRAIMRPGRVTHVFYRSTHWMKRKVAERIKSARA